MTVLQQPRGRILLVNPIQGIDGFLPLGVSMISAALKEAGHDVRLFDSTLYEIDASEHTRTTGENILEFKKSGIEKLLRRKTTDYRTDVRDLVEEYRPDIVGLSLTTSNNYPLAMSILAEIRKVFRGPVVVGGYIPTVAADRVLNEPVVDAICVGEGEDAFVEFCNAVAQGEDSTRTPNIHLKKNGTVIRNPMRPLKDPNLLPYPDWTIYDDSCFYKPFVGEVYKAGHVEMSRGCPYQCTYCIEPTLQRMFKGLGKYHRRKSPKRMIEELVALKNRYSLDMFKFWDGTFLVFPPGQLEEFADLYKTHVGLPFMVTTRAETTSREENVRLLKEAGCVCISMGIESGSERIRHNVLQRKMSDQQIIEAFRLLKKYQIRTSALNMIGLPGETRDDVMQTVRLNRIAGSDSSRPNIFQPYEGTPIRDLCIEKGYIEPDEDEFRVNKSMLRMPQLSPSEIQGLKRTFILYKVAPEWLYPLIRFTEREGRFRALVYKILTTAFYFELYGDPDELTGQGPWGRIFSRARQLIRRAA